MGVGKCVWRVLRNWSGVGCLDAEVGRGGRDDDAEVAGGRNTGRVV